MMPIVAGLIGASAALVMIFDIEKGRLAFAGAGLFHGVGFLLMDETATGALHAIGCFALTYVMGQVKFDD